ncbi:MAG: D-2-hydroxyacid dehydrogenase, partial [Parachlamydia sp.]|nr:D-2-hydroxyacid dehydrogenase [Parachlamydia sp.]
MNIVLIQGQLTAEEIHQLLNEFPQFLFLPLGETAFRALTSEQWKNIEILYGSRLSQEDLAKAQQLRWLHSPIPNLTRICLDDLDKRGNILVTFTQEEGAQQIGEFVIAGILAFSKQLFIWRDADHNPQTLWDSKWRDAIWTLSNRTLLQIGLAKAGSEIARQGRQMGMRVLGVQRERSFHPYCQKTFAMTELHTLLPEADVVSICLARGKPFHENHQAILHQEEFQLMKKDSILSITGSGLVDANALAEAASTGKFRGILLDASYQTPISAASP